MVFTVLFCLLTPVVTSKNQEPSPHLMVAHTMKALAVLLALAATCTANPTSCPADNSSLDHTVHLPHPTDCNAFLLCDNGVGKLKRCPAGLHFNPALQVCDWPDNAGCVVQGPEEAPTDPPDSEEGGDGSGDVPTEPPSSEESGEGGSEGGNASESSANSDSSSDSGESHEAK